MARQCYGMRRLNVKPIAWQGTSLLLPTKNLSQIETRVGLWCKLEHRRLQRRCNHVFFVFLYSPGHSDSFSEAFDIPFHTYAYF